MQYLVQMRLSTADRPTTSEDGVAFIEQFILRTLDSARNCRPSTLFLLADRSSGAVALVLIVNAESVQELDDLLTGLPVWPRMETQVTPLTTRGTVGFEGRFCDNQILTARKPLILKRRDVGVVDRARLEIDSARAC